MPFLYPKPSNELERLLAVEEHELIDSSPEAAFDDLALLAADICEAPIALITLIHERRQWIKARIGANLTETQRDISFCTHAICQTDLFIVPDALEDDRFRENPLVTQDPSIRFYAGVSLLTKEGHAVGTLCVLDRVPRVLTPHQQRALKVLSQHVCAQLEVRRLDTLRRRAEESLAQANAELERRVSERTAQLQQAVQQAEDAKCQIANMVERMSDGVLAFDLRWRFDYVNKKAAELLGRSANKMLGHGLLEIFPEASGSPFLAMCQRSAAEQRPLQMDAYYEPRDVWFDCRCYPAAEGVSVFFQDITTRKEAEMAFERERQLSNAIIESLPGTFYFYDEDGQYLRWNAGAEKVTGLTHEQYPLIPAVEKVAVADRARLAAAIKQVFATGSGSLEARLLHVSGDERWHLLTGRTLVVEGRRCLVGIGVDISDRKAAEEALAGASSRLEIAVEASSIGLWEWEIESGVVHYSSRYRRQLGYSEAEFPHTFDSWKNNLHPEDLVRMEEFVRHFLEGDQCDYEQEYRMRHRDGSYRWMFTRARVFRTSQGRPERMVGCHLDLTERRQMEQDLRQSRERLRALAEHQHLVREEEAGRIARELHDELGAALTGLKIDLGWVDRRVAQQEGEGKAAIHGRIQAIDRQLDETIDSVRKVCHALRPAVFDHLGLAEAIDWQTSEFQTRNGIRCLVERDETICLEEGKSIAVFRILQELLTNVTRHAKATEVIVRGYCQEANFHLSVADNGSGIPDDALMRSDRFGLVGVRERVLAAEGTVTFERTRGGGTTVKVCLPLHCQACV